jgi:hypothetical protein
MKVRAASKLGMVVKYFQLCPLVLQGVFKKLKDRVWNPRRNDLCPDLGIIDLLLILAMRISEPLTLTMENLLYKTL